jgi:hypothetical protein
MMHQELRRQLLDIVDRRDRLTDYEIDDLFAALDNARYWMRREKEHRDALRVSGDCHQIEGAPV